MEQWFIQNTHKHNIDRAALKGTALLITFALVAEMILMCHINTKSIESVFEGE